MSRKGVGRTTPFTTTLILPPCSTTNSRPDPSWALVTKTGESNPETILVRPTTDCAAALEAPSVKRSASVPRRATIR